MTVLLLRVVDEDDLRHLRTWVSGMIKELIDLCYLESTDKLETKYGCFGACF